MGNEGVTQDERRDPGGQVPTDTAVQEGERAQPTIAAGRARPAVDRASGSGGEHWLGREGALAVLGIYTAVVGAFFVGAVPGLQRWLMLGVCSVGAVALYRIVRGPSRPGARSLIPAGTALFGLPVAVLLVPTTSTPAPESALKVEVLPGQAASEIILPWGTPMGSVPRGEEDMCSEEVLAWAAKHGTPRLETIIMRVGNSGPDAQPIGLPEARVANVHESAPVEGFTFSPCGGGGATGRARLSIELPGSVEFSMSDENGQDQPFGYTLAPEEMVDLEVSIAGSGPSRSGDIEFAVRSRGVLGTHIAKGPNSVALWSQPNAASPLVVTGSYDDGEVPFLCIPQRSVDPIPCSAEDIAAYRP